MTNEAVHLTPESLDEYFRLGVVSVFQLSTELDARLEIDPPSDQMRLFVPARGGVPEVTDFERIRVDRIDGVGSTSSYRLIFDASQMHYAAYQLIESIVSYLREGNSFRQAVGESVADMKDLLANRTRLSDEVETGLWGELLLLEHLVGRVGEEPAIDAWLGPENSEHDFSFTSFEAEVKTTRAETRHHRIGTDTQLERSPDRPLYLVSIQVTLAGAATRGRTLPRLVADVRSTFKRSAHRFDAALHGLHYYDNDADLYRTEFQLRSTPRAYLVDDRFPAVTRSRLEPATPSPWLISDVRYRVDVGGLPYAAVPTPLDDFCEVPH